MHEATVAPSPLKRPRAMATLRCWNRRDPAVPTAAVEPVIGSGASPALIPRPASLARCRLPCPGPRGKRASRWRSLLPLRRRWDARVHWRRNDVAAGQERRDRFATKTVARRPDGVSAILNAATKVGRGRSRHGAAKASYGTFSRTACDFVRLLRTFVPPGMASCSGCCTLITRAGRSTGSGPPSPGPDA